MCHGLTHYHVARFSIECVRNPDKDLKSASCRPCIEKRL